MPAHPRRTVKWWLWRVLRGAAFVYAAVALALFFGQRLLLFPTWAVTRGPRPSLPPSAEVWVRPLEGGGQVEAFFLPAPDAAEVPAPLVVFFHGNAERIDDWVELLARYRLLGASVLLVEFRGYGRSGGSPSRDALVDDGLWFTRRALGDSRVDPRRLVLHGRSLGGAVACAVAEVLPPRALVLQSTLADTDQLAHARGMPGVLMRDRFDSVSVLRRLEVPVLLGHGERDTVIPFSHAERLAAVGPQVQLVRWPTAGHNDAPPSWVDWYEQIEGFLRLNGVL